MVGENELPWGSEKVLVHSITINDGGEHVAQIISARFKHCSHEVLEGAQAASSETATELACRMRHCKPADDSMSKDIRTGNK
jgi:hypothetical protein